MRLTAAADESPLAANVSESESESFFFPLAADVSESESESFFFFSFSFFSETLRVSVCESLKD